MLPHGKVSECVAIILCETIVLEAFLHVAPKAFRFLVGLRKS